MDTTQSMFLQAFAAAVKGEAVCWEQDVPSEVWESLLRLASAHQVLPIIYEAVYHCPAFSTAGQELIQSVRASVQKQVMDQAARTARFLSLYQALRKAGADPLVVKGILCRELYPDPDQRPSGDEDLLIQPEHYAICKEVFLQKGLQIADDQAESLNSYEVPFIKPGSTLRIELHRSLFPQESAAYGDLNRFFTQAHSQAVTVSVMGREIRTLAPTQHLLYLTCHGFKHFLHSGFGIRQVCDMMLFARAHRGEINWEEVLENCRAIHADRFAAALFRIGEIYLKFDPEECGIPQAWKDIPADPEPLLLDILAAGTHGKADDTRVHSSTITLDAVSAQNQGRRAKGLRAALFPSAESLAGRYPYLQEKPWLLPVAWASRILRYGTRDHRSGGAAESLRVGAQRVDLLKEYGIIE